jgi:Protein of unknown function (DUF3396)
LELHFPKGHTRVQRDAMVDVWQGYFNLFPDKMTHFLENDGKKLRPVKDRQFPQHFRDILPSLDEGQFFDGRVLGYVEDSKPGWPTHYAISGIGLWKPYGDRLSSLEAYFSSHWIFGHVDTLIENILSWCSRLKPRHGMAGLSAVRDFSSPPFSMHDSMAFPYLKRYPGLDYMDASHFGFLTGRNQKIRGSNWLTIIDDEFVDEVGGRKHIGGALSSDKDVLVHEWNGGILVQSGALPQLGDVNAGRFPEHYRAIARALKKIRFEEYAEDGYFRVPEPLDELDETSKWIRRFD